MYSDHASFFVDPCKTEHHNESKPQSHHTDYLQGNFKNQDILELHDNASICIFITLCTISSDANCILKITLASKMNGMSYIKIMFLQENNSTHKCMC